MTPYGKFKKEIMVIGEFPRIDDDQTGLPWRGKYGKTIERKYQELGVDLFEDCISLYAIQCHIDEQRAPSEYEISCCRQKVIKAIQHYQPKIVILHGMAAISSVIGYQWKSIQSGLQMWRGWTIPDHELKTWLCPTYAPSFIYSQEEENEVDVLWTKDLKQAFSLIDVPLPTPILEEQIEISDDIEGVLKALNVDGTTLAFDIETTGIKPYDTDKHHIVSIAFCNNENKAYAIPFPKTEQELQLLKTLLQNPRINKIAANMKFEDTWLNVLYGIQVTPWLFDTMLAAHILDNRPNISGLKIQAYLRFGMPSYDDTISPYLKSKDANTPNSIAQLTQNKSMFRKLLLYNGYDALLTYRLAQVQMKELGFDE
jgi:uracil-DNA glycosylase family 4